MQYHNVLICILIYSDDINIETRDSHPSLLAHKPTRLAKDRCKRPNFYSLLTRREKDVIKTLNKLYRQTWKADPLADANLVYYLGDNPNRKCWSANSGRIPTLRMSGGYMWSTSRKRVMTGREKLLTLGFPVTAGTASSMNVPVLPCRDVKRCGMIAGNAMNWNSVGVAQLIALTCFTYK